MSNLRPVLGWSLTSTPSTKKTAPSQKSAHPSPISTTRKCPSDVHVGHPPAPSSLPATTLPGEPCPTDRPPLLAAVALPQPQPLLPTPPPPPARSITDVTIPMITPSSRKRKKKATPRTFSLSCLCQPLINRGNSRSSVLRSTSAIPPTTRISLPMPSLLQVARPPILCPSSTLTLVSPPTQPVHPVFFNRPYPICRLRAPPPLRHSRVQMTLTAFKDSVLPIQAPQKPGLA